jgi:DnaJ-class molecular chaperone
MRNIISQYDYKYALNAVDKALMINEGAECPTCFGLGGETDKSFGDCTVIAICDTCSGTGCHPMPLTEFYDESL